MRTARWAAPLVAALVALVIAAVLFGLRGGTAGTGAPAGGSSSPAPAPTAPVSPGPDLPDPSLVRVAGYTTHGTTLTLHYTTGTPECYGTVDEPEVEESATSVVVTLRLLPLRDRTPQVCPDIALVDAVDVTLDAPLGARAVLDGGHGNAPVPQGAPLGADADVR